MKNKHRERKDKKKIKVVDTHFIEVKSKSRAGVEYSKYKLMIPANPQGQNHSARRIEKAKNKHASGMAKLRWSKVLPEERSAFGKMMVNSRKDRKALINNDKIE